MKKDTRALIRKLWRYLPLGYFVAAILCLCFAYGVAVGKWHVFPYSFLNVGFVSLRNLVSKQRPHYLHPAHYEGEGVVVYECEKVYPGVTLVTGLWKDGDDWNVGIHLVDLDGKILHEWRCNPRDIWPRSPHNDRRTGSFDDKTKTFVHGALLLGGGEVISNLEYFGLIRLNSRSEVIWKLPYRTHHSVYQDDEGSFWVCGQKWYETPHKEFVDLRPPFIEDTILRVSPDGTIEREISVLETIYQSGYEGLLRLHTGDVLHLNDVEVLSQRNAKAFDLFRAGDIMVSMRDINTICVIDGETERIKWSLTYPFIGQHDPDFTEDGYITVFDNSLDIFGGSRILRIEPSTREVEVLYGHKENQHFFTSDCGKHQHLPNGNMLITEACAGRVFEVTANGDVVWSWIVSRWNKNTVPEILEGTRYDAEYAGFIGGLRKDDK